MVPARPIDPDLWEALPVAFEILAEMLARTAPHHKLEELLADTLDNNPAAESLSERQRLLVWRLCRMALDAYTAEGQ